MAQLSPASVAAASASLATRPAFSTSPRWLCDRAASGVRETGAFVKDIEQWRFDWERPYSRDEWLDAVPTFGGSNRLPASTMRDLLAGIGAAIDAIGGRATYPMFANQVTKMRAAGA